MTTEDILFGNRLGHALHTRLGQRIVDLPSISVQAACARDVDNVPGLAVLDPEIRRCSAHNLEGRCSVQVDNRLPLLVRHLVDDAVPCVARIVDNDVDLASAKLGRLGDQCLDVGVVEHVACYCYCAAA